MRILKIAALSLAALPLFTGCGSSIKDDVKGHWASTTCETRPGAGGSSLFVKRDYDIQDTTWTGTLTFYTNNTCSTPTVVAVAKGPYTVGDENANVKGAYDAAFTLQTMTLTTKDEGTTGYLNSAPANTCGSATWVTNTTQDVTSTKGCSVLGVDLQNCGTEYELIKIENSQLLFGSRPADGSGPCSEAKRTSTDTYQGPLEKVK